MRGRDSLGATFSWSPGWVRQRTRRIDTRHCVCRVTRGIACVWVRRPMCCKQACQGGWEQSERFERRWRQGADVTHLDLQLRLVYLLSDRTRILLMANVVLLREPRGRRELVLAMRAVDRVDRQVHCHRARHRALLAATWAALGGAASAILVPRRTHSRLQYRPRVVYQGIAGSSHPSFTIPICS